MRSIRWLGVLILLVYVFVIPIKADEMHADWGQKAGVENESDSVVINIESEIETELNEGQYMDDHLMGYIEKQLLEVDGFSLFSSDYNSTKLTSLELDMYSRLKDMASDVAKGERTNLRVEGMLLSDYFKKDTWTKDELGLDAIYIPNSVNNIELAYERWKDRILYPEYSYRKALDAAKRDSPYEFYWSGLLVKHGIVGYVNVEFNPNTCEYDLKIDSVKLTITVSASQEYAIDYLDDKSNYPYEIDLEKIGNINGAIHNAKNIINDASSFAKNDYERLYYYKQKLCELNSYNYEAASSKDYYGNPWQIIYIFDGNPDTNVVCEGYAKAFQYLCEITDFDCDELVCYSVTGKMSNQNHMWNIVQMDDGNKYLVDVTNCDSDYVVDDSLFIAYPIAGDVETGYEFESRYNNVLYEYDEDTRNLYSDDELTLSYKPYTKDKKEVFQVFLDSCGGILENSSINCENGKQYGEFPIPVKEGYTFLGWYTAIDGGKIINESTLFNGESTLYAHWEKIINSGWNETSDGWIYINEDGSYLSNCWATIAGERYHFDLQGYRQTGWIQDGGDKYFLGAAGVLVTDEWVDGGKYYVDESGKYVPNKQRITAGWKQDSKGWWYQNADGTYPKSKWQQIGGKWYHFDANGYMQTGWLSDGGKWYYLESNGAMAANKWISGTYYVKADGSMATNEWVDGGKYYVDGNGKYVPNKQKVTAGWKQDKTGWWYQNADGTYPKNQWQQIGGKWYHFNASGYMQTGWLNDGGKWYYLESSGVMAANKWISGTYYVEANGVMATNKWVDGGRYYVDGNGKWVPGKK